MIRFLCVERKSYCNFVADQEKKKGGRSFSRFVVILVEGKAFSKGSRMILKRSSDLTSVVSSPYYLCFGKSGRKKSQDRECQMTPPSDPSGVTIGTYAKF